MKPLELAEFILCTYQNKCITPMKLQKLAYYAKVWTLVAGKDWIDVQFEKWPYGPVNSEIYHNYKKFGACLIAPSKTQTILGEDKVVLLKSILDQYVDYSAFTLSAMTHSEAPWQNTPDNAVISDDKILAYYCKQPFAKNFSNKSDELFHVLHSNTWHSFVLDMDKTEAEKYATYPSVEEFTHDGAKASDEFNKLLQNIDKLFS
jgi:uncharacterized phage-associated protein